MAGGWVAIEGSFYILEVSYLWYIVMSSTPDDGQAAEKRVRLSREQRLRQLLDVAWRLAREEGTDALTLPRMADEASVAKPVVYDHFGTRNGLLAALYQDFDARQTEAIDAALAASGPTLKATAKVIASSYVECVLAQGREIPGVLAGLAGSPELETVKRDYQLAFIEKCRKALAPFAGPKGIAQSGFWAMLGAADALSHAAATREITPRQAQDELYETIIALVGRNRR
jgi:AcrR family transcriptional regulator